MSDVNKQRTRRFRRSRRPATKRAGRSPAEWARLRALAAEMERRELLDAIAANRTVRERLEAELAAASRELDELLAAGRASGITTTAEMGDAAGMTRSGAHKRLVSELAA